MASTRRRRSLPALLASQELHGDACMVQCSHMIHKRSAMVSRSSRAADEEKRLEMALMAEGPY